MLSKINFTVCELNLPMVPKFWAFFLLLYLKGEFIITFSASTIGLIHILMLLQFFKVGKYGHAELDVFSWVCWCEFAGGV